MSDVIATIMAVAVHRENDNPCFAEGVIELRMADEAGGAFFELRQEDVGPIRADLEDLELLAKQARRLMRQKGVW